MRTLIIIFGGFVLFGLSLLVARWAGGSPRFYATAAGIFLPVWCAVALANMWIGVAHAGYSVAEELPIFLLIFGLPAALAAFIWWKAS